VLAGKGGVHSEKKLWIKRVIHNVGVGGDSVGIHFHVDKINIIPEPKKPFNKGRLYSSSLISGARKGT